MAGLGKARDLASLPCSSGDQTFPPPVGKVPRIYVAGMILRQRGVRGQAFLHERQSFPTYAAKSTKAQSFLPAQVVQRIYRYPDEAPRFGEVDHPIMDR